jgi:hypothetical protein
MVGMKADLKQVLLGSWHSDVMMFSGFEQWQRQMQKSTDLINVINLGLIVQQQQQ